MHKKIYYAHIELQHTNGLLLIQDEGRCALRCHAELGITELGACDVARAMSRIFIYDNVVVCAN